MSTSIPSLPFARAKELLATLEGKLVAVVGDIMLDEYVRGEVSRVSPEAPVPVVDFRERTLTSGGAANTAANLVSLGGKATLVGLIGQDQAGSTLRECIRGQRIGDEALVPLAERPTTHKLRIVARTQQIARVDVESRAPLEGAAEDALIGAIERLAERADAIVISDYAKGVVTDRVAQKSIEFGRKRSIPVVVDPKGRDYERYAGATVITPNLLELEVATATSTDNEDERVAAAASQLLEGLDGTAVLVTRGAAGMTLLRRREAVLHLPTVARSVFDVTGAGDTVVGMLTLALAAGVEYREALVLATHAASIAVSRAGTVAVTRDALLESFSSG